MKIIFISLLFLLCPKVATAAEFDGYPCRTENCSGHRAGYDWAAQQGITDPNQCTDKSQSFIEGCRAYADGGSGHFTYDYKQEYEE